MIEYLPRNVRHTDLHLIQYGIEECSPGHHHGPAVRDHYLIHYIIEGTGRFEVNGVTYTLGKGQGFLICPGVVTFYQADHATPWHYCWVGFSGLHADAYLKLGGLTANSPLFRYDKDDAFHSYLLNMISSKHSDRGRDLQLNGLLYLMLSLIIANTPHSGVSERGAKENRIEMYVNQVIDFIELHYYEKFTISDIAHHVGLNRSYLCSLFKDRTSSSMQDFLIRYRMNKACELMAKPDLSIGDISRSVGYEDPLLFSKIFKKVHGVSPKQYRMEQLS